MVSLQPRRVKRNGISKSPPKLTKQKVVKAAKMNVRDKKTVARSAKISRVNLNKQQIVAAPKRQLRERVSSQKKYLFIGYTADEYNLFTKLLTKFLSKYSSTEMKEILRKNDQTVGGTCEELAAKIADGKILGKIPRCPSCYGGKLKFSYQTGTYSCPGFVDDLVFRNCQKKFSMAEIKRDKFEL